jgi:hypothetical protein
MAFFHELIESIEMSPGGARPRVPNRTSSALAYAPRRLRPDKPEAAGRLESEAAYWRERALGAERRLLALESRVQRLASSAGPR